MPCLIYHLCTIEPNQKSHNFISLFNKLIFCQFYQLSFILIFYFINFVVLIILFHLHSHIYNFSSRDIFSIIFFFFFFFLLFRAASTTYGGSQARGPIGATAAHLCHSHSTAGSEPHLHPTPQLMAMPDP